MSEPTPIRLDTPDAGGRSAGEILRRAREAQGMTLEGLASVIKVAPNKLEALEQGRYNVLPDASFTRALAMTVCRALKIDPSDVLASLPAARPVALAGNGDSLNQPFKEGHGSALFDKHFDWSGLLSPKYLAPIGLLLAAAIIHFLPEQIEWPNWLPRAGQPGIQAQAPASAASMVEAAPVAPSVTSAAQVASAVMPLVLDADMAASAPASGAAASEAGSTSAVPEVTTPKPENASATGLSMSSSVSVPASAALAMDISADTWIEIKDADGQKLFSRLARSGEQVALEGVAPIQVRIGNVSGVQMRYKGQAVDMSAYTRSNVARFELK